MGKSNKRPRNTKTEGSEAPPTSPKTSTTTKVPHSKHKVSLPLAFPTNLATPKEAFLRNQPPYQKSFRAALETAYEGLIVDDASFQDEASIQNALDTLEQRGFFRTDVTQPFGLGTKCAKTYVTRCLLGERGTTYKYLGLRMFSYPWDSSVATQDKQFQRAIETMAALNQSLTARSQHHLTELSAKRQSRGAEPCRERPGFDISLINRMENSSNLKPEPVLGHGRCSVSWHADSSLEHYSTIAVYHTLQPSVAVAKSTTKEEPGAWSVVLRVAPHSEGPTAARRGTDIDSSIVTETPPLAVSLPTGATYYLCEDFNHHHQHAVLAEGDAGIRFSSTHRLLRESHNVAFMRERCKNTCSNFHKKGPKIWRSEQLLLTEMETEWLRQYFIQGTKHNELLWCAWGDDIQSLLQYWGKLEARTKAVVDLLQHAAEGKCLSAEAVNKQGPPPPKSERRLRDKRRKAVTVVNDILDRDANSKDAAQLLYEPLVALLLERAIMRELWNKREHDHVFHEMEPYHRPMDIPFAFNVANADEKSEQGSLVAKSPMPGSAKDLRSLGERLIAYGRAWISGLSSDLPRGPVVAETVVAAATVVPRMGSDGGDNKHARSLTWEGWNSRRFGLELQSPWAELLLQGKKAIETRSYELPSALIGKRIDILRSVAGTARVSSLGNSIAVGSNLTLPPVQRLGWCTFERVIHYTDKSSFEADESSHLVTEKSGYAWKDGETKVVYGWRVGEYGIYKDPSDFGTVSMLERRMRSLFELLMTEREQAAIPNKKAGEKRTKSHGKSDNKDKRKKRY